MMEVNCNVYQALFSYLCFLFQKSKPLRAGPMLPHLALSHTHSAADSRPLSAPVEADPRPRSFTVSKRGVWLGGVVAELCNIMIFVVDVSSPKSKKKPVSPFSFIVVVVVIVV